MGAVLQNESQPPGAAGLEGWPEDVATPIAEVLAGVRARRAELVATVFDGVRGCPGYANLGDTDLGVVRAGVAASVDLLTSLFETGPRLAPADLATIWPLGGQRARQGVPLADVLGSVVVGIARAWEFFVGEASLLARDCDRARVLDAVDPWFSDALTAATEAMARGYLEEQTPAPRPPDTRAALLLKMLSGVIDDTHALECRARKAGWHPAALHGIVLFTAPTAANVSPSALEDARTEWMASMPRALGTGRHIDPVPHAVTVTCAEPGTWDDATAVAGRIALRRRLVALVSDDTVGVGDLQHLYCSMADILCLAADVARAPGAVRPAALCTFRFVAALPEPHREAILGPLVSRLRELQASHYGRELIATADTVAELGGVANAAAALGVDPRTIGRRLRRLGECLGVSLAVRDDRLLVELALHAMRLRR